VHTFGGAENLEVVELPEPEPGEGQIRIRVTAATVNPADTAVWSGFYADGPRSEQPVVAGLELAGVVDAVGPGSMWQPGDRVAAVTGGAHAELVVVPDRSAARVPDDIDLVAAATLPMNGLTVQQAIDRLALSAGDTLVVSGAAGAVGLYMVELCVPQGIDVVAIASRKDEALLQGLGIKHLVPRGLTAPDRVRGLYPDGVDAALDAAVLGGPLLHAVRDGGKMAAVRRIDGETERGIDWFRVNVGEYFQEQEKLQGLFAKVADGTITLRVAETYPPERAGEAYERLDEGGTRGRLMITFAE
jgi:NADPH:quinone reductase-like Zn-dependent oxidoreductase